MIQIFFCDLEKIFVTRVSPANRVSPTHVISPYKKGVLRLCDYDVIRYLIYIRQKPKYLENVIIDLGLRWLSRLSDVLPPLRSRVRALYRSSDRTWEEFVNTLPKVVGFLRVLQFPHTGKVDSVVRINS